MSHSSRVALFFMPVKNVLSLFNGISALHLALDRAGIQVENCYYSEIDKYANQVTEKNYPNDIQLGDVTKWQEWDLDWSSIDLLAGGSPCQGFSFAGKQAGTLASVNGEIEIVSTREKYLELKARKENLENIIFLSESYLFWEYVLILDHIKSHNPNLKFLLENVKMKKELLQMIDDAMGVKSVVINSALLSAQNRVRHYWCNWEVKQPEDKGVLLKDIIEGEPDVKFNLSNQRIQTIKKSRTGGVFIDPSKKEKIGTLVASYHKIPSDGNYIIQGGAIRGRYLVDGKRQDHKGKTAGLTEQRLEVRKDEKTNTLTTVQKDNVVVLRPASIVGRRLNERGVRDDYNKDVAITQCLQVKHKNDKTGCLTTVDKDNVLSIEPPGRYPDIYNRCDISYRKLTPIECERLQTFPDGWTDCVSNTQRYKALGNAWTVDVIAHILQCGFKS